MVLPKRRVAHFLCVTRKSLPTVLGTRTASIRGAGCDLFARGQIGFRPAINART